MTTDTYSTLFDAAYSDPLGITITFPDADAKIKSRKLQNALCAFRARTPVYQSLNVQRDEHPNGSWTVTIQSASALLNTFNITSASSGAKVTLEVQEEPATLPIAAPAPPTSDHFPGRRRVERVEDLD